MREVEEGRGKGRGLAGGIILVSFGVVARLGAGIFMCLSLLEAAEGKPAVVTFPPSNICS
jgi:hypothetical protein